MLGVDEDVFAVDVAFAQPVDKLIEEVLGWRIGLLLENVHQQEVPLL
jgi:hypothetical protein